MVLVISELKKLLNLSKKRILKDYIKGSDWTLESLIYNIEQYELGFIKKTNESELFINHINSFFANHYLYKDFYSIYVEAYTISDPSVKVFMPSVLYNSIKAIDSEI